MSESPYGHGIDTPTARRDSERPLAAIPWSLYWTSIILVTFLSSNWQAVRVRAWPDPG
jgi:hypothetical protein